MLPSLLGHESTGLRGIPAGENGTEISASFALKGVLNRHRIELESSTFSRHTQVVSNTGTHTLSASSAFVRMPGTCDPKGCIYWAPCACLTRIRLNLPNSL